MPVTRDKAGTAVRRAAVQLLGGLLLAVLVPWALRHLVMGGDPFRIGPRNDLLGTGVALVIGNYFMQRLVAYPGTRSSSYILPVFAAAYGAVLTAFFFLRLDYSRFQFISSFTNCVAWYYISGFALARLRKRRFAVVPEGDAPELTAIDGVEWRLMASPQGSFLNCDGLVADFHANLSPEWERLIADKALAGVPVYHVKQIRESITGRVDIQHLSENNFGSLIPGLAYIKIKQWLDILAAAAALIVLAPALAMIALLVRLDSPGPAFFRQSRMGYRGHPFTVVKFRTMRHEQAPAGSHSRESAMTQTRDDRVTRLGRTLRVSRLDELPQLWNVLRGQMSWIGPRPEAVVLSEWYESELPFYRYRHIVRPGITGWAQVNQGHVTDLDDVVGKLQYDFYYIKYFSPWLDILIVLRTMKIMVTGIGAR